MATTDLPSTKRDVEYPTSDGKPMAETELHFWNMVWLAQMLYNWYADDQQTYVGANMLMYYVEGNPRRHVSPDVFVTRGIPKRRRDYYLVWEEGKAPDVVIELTSSSTSDEDLKDKFRLYRDVLKVREYFLFDPHAEYLDPPLQGFRLLKGQYKTIQPVEGRIPSEVLGLHFEQRDWTLRLYNPGTKLLLPIPDEEIKQAKEQARKSKSEARKAKSQAKQAELQAKQAELQAKQAEKQAQQATAEKQQLADALSQAEAELERLRQQIRESGRQGQ
jgi:Uma2 family endonuclease